MKLLRESTNTPIYLWICLTHCRFTFLRSCHKSCAGLLRYWPTMAFCSNLDKGAGRTPKDACNLSHCEIKNNGQ